MCVCEREIKLCILCLSQCGLCFWYWLVWIKRHFLTPLADLSPPWWHHCQHPVSLKSCPKCCTSHCSPPLALVSARLSTLSHIPIRASVSLASPCQSLFPFCLFETLQAGKTLHVIVRNCPILPLHRTPERTTHVGMMILTSSKRYKADA